MQLRLTGFDLDRLAELGRVVRDLYAGVAHNPDRVASTVDDGYLGSLAGAVTGRLGGRVGVAPRLFLRKLVADILDRVDEFADFDPRAHYALTLSSSDLTETERDAVASVGGGSAPVSADDVELDLP